MKPHLSGLILLTWLGWACIVVAGDRPNIFWITGEDNGQYLGCYGDPVARTNVLQVQGEAIVRNNLLMAAQGSGFASTDHQGRTVHLAFMHNTIISRRRTTEME